MDAPISETQKIKKIAIVLREIEAGFRLNLSNLHEKIEFFESKAWVQDGTEKLTTDSELRAKDLENEVRQLRQDLESLKESLGLKFNSGV